MRTKLPYYRASGLLMQLVLTKFLREQFPNVKGLQPTSLAVHSGFDIQRRECLNVYGSHWITIAGDSSPGTVM